MDELRVVLSVATGAVIGCVVVIALTWTLRVLGETAGATAEPAGVAAGSGFDRPLRARFVDTDADGARLQLPLNHGHMNDMVLALSRFGAVAAA